MTPRSDGPDWTFVRTGFALCVVIALCLAYVIWRTLRHSENTERVLRRLAAHFGVDYDRLLEEEGTVDPAADTGPIPVVPAPEKARPPVPRVPAPIWTPPPAAPLDLPGPGEVPESDPTAVVGPVITVGGPPPAALIATIADGVEHEPASGSAASTDAAREAVHRARTAAWVEAELERIRAAGQAAGGDHRRHGKDM